MQSSEGLNDIVEDPNFEWEDDQYIDDEDELEDGHGGTLADESDQKANAESGSQSPTAKSMASSLRSEVKRARVKQVRQPAYNIPLVSIRRDPVIESIVEARKLSIIENSYTRLAQVSLLAPRPSQRLSTLELRPRTTDTDNGVKERLLSSRNIKRLSSSKASEIDTDEWDDGSAEERRKEAASKTEKSAVQLYEETCERLHICPCSMITRMIHTTKLSLQNYGLGPRGCLPLAVALARNTTVLSLNLSGNNIGNKGMAYIYQVLTENSYIEEYNLSYNNLGTDGIAKLAAVVPTCAQLKNLSVAGNELTASDIKLLLNKLENHNNLKSLNISHNQLDEQGGIIVAEWLAENSTLLTLDVSWCCIRLQGAKALAKSIGDNNKLTFLDLSYNSFTNDTLDLFASSFTRNMALLELNLRGNQFISRYDPAYKKESAVLTTGKEAHLYKMLVAASSNQTLKIIRLGQNHIDERCLVILLRALSKVVNLTLEELDFTGLAINASEVLEIQSLFGSHSSLKCFVGPVRQTIDHFANNLLNCIYEYCEECDVSLAEVFSPNEETHRTVPAVTYEQFLDGLRRAKIPFPSAYINEVIKYLGRESEPGMISIRSLYI